MAIKTDFVAGSNGNTDEMNKNWVALDNVYHDRTIKIKSGYVGANERFAYYNDPNAYATATTYREGDVVSHNGSLYVATKNGTSAGVAPTKTYGKMPDGTTEWRWVGVGRKVSTSDSFAISVAPKHVSAVKEIRAWTDKNCITYTGGEPVRDGAETVRLIAVDVAPSAGNSMGTYDVHNGAVEFFTDSSILSFGYTIPFAEEYYFVVYVDDVLVSPSIIRPQSYIAGNCVNLSIDGARRLRKIRIMQRPNMWFTNVSFDVGAKVFPTKNNARVLVLGDSLTAGAGGLPVRAGLDIASLIGSAIDGTSDVWNIGSGATGFVSNYSGQKRNFVDRLPDIIRQAPDILIINGNHNDESYSEVIQKQAYTTFLQSIRTSLPNCRIIVFGTCHGSVDNPSSFLTAEQYLFEVCNSIGGIVTIPVSTDATSGNWVTGTGSEESQNGTGNGSYFQLSDKIHPNQLGIFYRADNYIRCLKGVL